MFPAADAGLRQTPEFNEAEVVRGCLDGDDDAYRRLLQQYQGLIMGLLRRTARGADHAEDLAQDVYVRILRGLPSFNGHSQLATWIYRIALNVRTDDERRQACAKNCAMNLGAVRTGVRLGRRDRAFSQFERRDYLAKGLRRLTARSRGVLIAHYVQGRPYQELSDELQVPVGTLKTRARVAKRQLREVLVGL